MDDDEMYELEQEAEAIEQAEYQRGLKLTKGSTKTIHETCPWCGKQNSYEFCLVSSWHCNACGYTPGADLFGGKFS